MPDKAIDVLDEVCSKAKTTKERLEQEIEETKDKIKSLKNDKNKSIINNNFALAFTYKQEENKQLDKLNKLELKGAEIPEHIFVSESDYEKIHPESDKFYFTYEDE